MVLFDSSSAPILSLAPGARHDFIVAHDVKEVGPHTLACSTVYITAAGERKYFPQYFKFASHNPLSVRTKVLSPHMVVAYGQPSHGASCRGPPLPLHSCIIAHRCPWACCTYSAGHIGCACGILHPCRLCQPSACRPC